MSGVPDKVLVGPTTYVHIRHREKDYYVPDFIARNVAGLPSLLLDENSVHFWRYGVSKEHSNTVFFYNPKTHKSVWVLPVVHHDGRTELLGAGEAMRPIYASNVDDAGTDETPGKRGGVLSSTRGREEDKGGIHDGKQEVDVTSSPSPPNPMKLAIVRQKYSARNGVPRRTLSPTEVSQAAPPSLGSPAEPPALPEGREPARLEKTHDAGVQGPANSLSPPAEEEPHMRTLPDRLAAWRARQRGHVSPSAIEEQKSFTVDGVGLFSVAAAETIPREAVALHTYTTSPAGPPDTKRGISPTESANHKVKDLELLRTPEALQDNVHGYTPDFQAASFSLADAASLPTSVSESVQSHKAPTEALRAELASSAVQDMELSKVVALLRQEKIATMQQEMVTLECRRRALSVEQTEAENRMRLAQARTATERVRLQEMEQAANEEAQRRAAIGASAATESRLQDVNEYIEKKRQLQDAANSTLTDSIAYASRIASRLADAVPSLEKISFSTGKKSSDADRDVGARLTPPHYRVHQAGRTGPTVSEPSASFPEAATHVHQAAEKSAGGGAPVRAARTPLTVAPASDNATAARRHQTHLAYAAPHLYEGDVIAYRPSSSFTRRGLQKGAATARNNGSCLTPKSLSEPTAPVLLTASREGPGMQYYDAAHNHFFRGTWRKDMRDGPGVLSLPASAVQGGWRNDKLTGPAILQTRHSKGTVTFVSAKPVSGSRPPYTSRSGVSRREKGALQSTASCTSSASDGVTTVTGNAVVELDNKSLFIGVLKEGRVRAPYVLQLGQGDYIEWLGATDRAGRCGRPSVRSSGELVRHDINPPTSIASSAQAITGECRIRFRNGDTYVGHVSDLQLDGFGYYRFAEDGHSYTGHFKGGWPHGKGFLVFANGDTYRGGFTEGLFDGHGTYASQAEHYIYEGDWVAGEMDGEGSLTFSNGDVWQGTFSNSRRVAGSYTRLA